MRPSGSDNLCPETLPLIQPSWLSWQGATVKKIAKEFYKRTLKWWLPRCREPWAELGILADALEDAGCDDQDILDHLREDHTPCSVPYLGPGCWQNGCWLLNHLLGKPQLLTAEFTFHAARYGGVPVVNPDGWFGHSWLVEIGLSYTTLLLIVEGESLSTVLDELADSAWGRHVIIKRSEYGDYGHEDFSPEGRPSVWYDLHGKLSKEPLHEVSWSGDRGLPCDISNVHVHGNSVRFSADVAPFQCLYGGPGLPKDGVDSVAYSRQRDCVRCKKRYYPAPGDGSDSSFCSDCVDLVD